MGEPAAPERLLALARLQAAETHRWQAIAEHDAAIEAAIRAGLPYRVIGRTAGLDHAAVSRRAKRLNQPPRKGGLKCS